MFVPNGLAFSAALTIKYRELSEKDKSKISLVPLEKYASIPGEDSPSSPVFNRVKKACKFAIKENRKDWEKNDWAIGVPLICNPADTFEVLNYYSKLIEEEYE